MVRDTSQDKRVCDIQRPHPYIEQERKDLFVTSHPSTSFNRAALILPWIFTLAWVFTAPTARAEMVIFPEGGFLKVTSYQIDDDVIRVVLPSGVHMTLSILRVERILDDEIPTAPEPEPEPPPRFSLRFHPSHPEPETPYGDLIYQAAKRHAMNPAVVAAVVRAESAFDPSAVSVKGAQGLMQLMPATGRRFGLRSHEAFEPAKNIEAGTRYLSWLTKRFDGNLSSVLAAYNSGEGTVDRYGGVPPYRETRNYLKRIYKTLGLPPDAG